VPYYQDGAVTIYHGDCLELLDSLQVDALVTDPPYGIGLENHGAGKHRRADAFTIIGDDDGAATLSVLKWAEALGLVTVVFASPKKPWPGAWRNILAWDKGGAVGGGGDPATCWKQTWELVQIARNGPLKGGRDEGVIRRLMTPQQSQLHPAQKPISLMAYLIDKATYGTVLDPFMGSGTTLVAAKALGRHAVGIEIEERHCETAVKRLRQESLMLHG